MQVGPDCQGFRRPPGLRPETHFTVPEGAPELMPEADYVKNPSSPPGAGRPDPMLAWRNAASRMQPLGR